ncbi:hypothetical protein ACWFQ8_20045 [Streptomyces sp. NPDC055254]
MLWVAALWTAALGATGTGTGGATGATGAGAVTGATGSASAPPWTPEAATPSTGRTAIGPDGADRADGRLARTPSGRIPRMRRLHPEQAGVRPAAAPGGPPAFVGRDAEPALRAALSGRGPHFVLLLGEPLAGSTRLAYEVTRSCFPGHAFVRPLSRAALPEAVRVAARRRRAVLWLDGLEDHLGARGLTPAHLDELRAVVVLATMRPDAYRSYRRRDETRLTGSDRDSWRTPHELLGRTSAVVEVARLWSPGERRRAGEHRADPRIGAALRAGDHAGVAEVLAGGPRSLSRWEDARLPGARPRGAALVAAAVDCRRAGLRRPVPQAWLRDLHAPYLAGRGGADIRPEPFAEAWDWAVGSEPGPTTGGLLEGSADRGCTAGDHLLHGLPGAGPAPDHLWRGLLARAAPEDAYDLGLRAHRDGRPDRAVQALSRALAGGVGAAALPLAVATGDAGRPRRAAADLAALARRCELRLGDRHPDTLAARYQLAFFTGEAGHFRAAAARFADLAADAAAALGPGHPDALAARHQAAYFTGEAGDRRTAARQLAALLSDRLRPRPADGRPGGPGEGGDPAADRAAVLALRRGLIWYGSAGEAEAERESARLLADTREQLGPDHPHTLAVRATRAALAARAGRTEEAGRAWADLAADRARVLGAEHPHVVHTRLELARALLAGGRREDAAAVLDRVLTESARFLEPGHRHLRRARELRATTE